MNDRIRPATPAQWSEDARAVLGSTQSAADHPDGLGPPNILYTIAHHPTLLPPFLAFSATLAMRGVLPRRDSELLALRTAWRCQSAFEWGHHVEYALAEGLTQQEIDRVAGSSDDEHWNERDRLLLHAADELHERQQLSDATFDALRRELDEAQIVELTFVVGSYTMLSMVANATGVPLETRLPPLPG